MLNKRAALGVAAVVLLVAGLWRAGPVVAIGVAYKARMLCSGIFVSHRDPAAVLVDLQIDDLWTLRFINASVDTGRQSVTATALGIVTRRAVYRDGLGCALVPAGWTPSPPLPAATPAVTPAIVESPPGEGPRGSALPAAIDRAFAETDPARPRRTRAVVVVQRGQIVGERYAADIRQDTALPGWSMSKSVVNALVGVLVGQGRLTLDAPIPIPEWHGAADPRSTITLDHLLRMSSGLRFDENMESPRSDVMRMLLDADDAAALAIRQPLDFTPGTRGQYSSGTTNIIARAVRNAMRDDETYLTFPRRALFDRIGMAGAVIETDAAGTFVGSSYVHATARDWARFGMLYLQDGVWDGARILPEGWVAYSRTSAPADPAKRYGAHFWLAVPEEYCASGDRLPQDAFHAAGHEGQFVTVVPSRDVVVVRLGRARLPKTWDHCGFMRDVLAALSDGAIRPGI